MQRSADCEEVALRVDRCALEVELSRMLRRDVDAPVVFGPAMSLSAPAASRWAATLGFVLDEIRRGTGSLDHPLVRSRVEQLVIDQLLLAQRHNFSEQLETGHLPARPPAVRRAIEIIRSRAADPLTVPMLAELAGVSVRSLQQGFGDYLGTTPLGYLRSGSRGYGTTCLPLILQMAYQSPTSRTAGASGISCDSPVTTSTATGSSLRGRRAGFGRHGA